MFLHLPNPPLGNLEAYLPDPRMEFLKSSAILWQPLNQDNTCDKGSASDQKVHRERKREREREIERERESLSNGRLLDGVFFNVL